MIDASNSNGGLRELVVLQTIEQDCVRGWNVNDPRKFVCDVRATDGVWLTLREIKLKLIIL